MSTPTNVQLVLTPDEKQALLQLLDQAVRAGGLNVAGNALVLAQKIDKAPPVDDTAKQSKVTSL